MICSCSAEGELYSNSLPNHSHLRSAAYGAFLQGSADVICGIVHSLFFKYCVNVRGAGHWTEQQMNANQQY